MDQDLVARFAKLHSGLGTAFGTGAGRWVKRPPTQFDFSQHLQGVGDGIGIAPLREDSTVLFAAIDLDEPDFDAAKEMQEYIPGPSFVEKSRSGNAHVWCYFSGPIEAWVPMGILREATLAAGKDHVEVFPKNHDFAKVKLGNYINLPYHGTRRWVHQPCDHPHDHMEMPGWEYLTLEMFLDAAEAGLNNPDDWRKRADWLQLSSPANRENAAEFGTQKNLHICAQHIISGDAGPITQGHRSVVYFSLAKQLLNWEQLDEFEVLEIMRKVNQDSAPDSIEDRELVRIIGNAQGKTSTGCDDPLFAPYRHPDCRIGN